MIKKLLCLVLIGLLISGCKSQKEETIDSPLINEFVVEAYNNEEHPDTKTNQGVKDDKKAKRRIKERNILLRTIRKMKMIQLQNLKILRQVIQKWQTKNLPCRY